MGFGEQDKACGFGVIGVGLLGYWFWEKGCVLTTDLGFSLDGMVLGLARRRGLGQKFFSALGKPDLGKSVSNLAPRQAWAEGLFCSSCLD